MILSSTGLATSILLQFTAAVLALRLIRTTGWRVAWTLIAVAIFLMGIRRSFTFYQLVTSGSQKADFSAEMIALAVSVFMVLGIALIGAMFATGRRTEDRFRSLVESSSDLVWETDAHGVYTYVSPKVKEMLGYEAENFLGKTPFDFMAKKDIAKAAETFGKIAKSHAPFSSLVYTFISKDGREVVLESGGGPLFTPEKRFSGYFGIDRDISRRRNAERKIRDMAKFPEESPEPILRLDKNAVVLYANHSSSRLLSCWETDGRCLDKQGLIKKILVSGEAENIETTCCGTYYDLLFMPFPEDGYVNVYGRDITGFKRASEDLQKAHDELELRIDERTHQLQQEVEERKRTQEELIRANRVAVIASQAKSEFLAGMSHELRTPLNAIIGFSDAIKSKLFGDLCNDRYEEYVNNIHESGHHLLELVNDVLDLSKIEAGALELSEGPVDINEVAESSVRLIRPRAENGKVKIKVEIAKGIPDLHGDERRIKQILLNLLSNAVKFTPKKGKVILKAFLVNGGALNIIVSDNGVGMAEEDIPKALAEFGQVDDATVKAHEGTGLGLPLVKYLVEMHDGTFDLQSKKGLGTTVTLGFPAERVIV